MLRDAEGSRQSGRTRRAGPATPDCPPTNWPMSRAGGHRTAPSPSSRSIVEKSAPTMITLSGARPAASNAASVSAKSQISPSVMMRSTVSCPRRLQQRRKQRRPRELHLGERVLVHADDPLKPRHLWAARERQVEAVAHQPGDVAAEPEGRELLICVVRAHDLAHCVNVLRRPASAVMKRT